MSGKSERKERMERKGGEDRLSQYVFVTVLDTCETYAMFVSQDTKGHASFGFLGGVDIGGASVKV